jgi:hypothetical protein
MQVEQVKELKNIVEATLLRTLQNFEKETGCRVEDVALHSQEYLGMDRDLTGVYLSVRVS